VAAGCFIGPAASVTGGPCASSTQCAFPPTNGYCLTAAFPDGGATGFAGGYCSSQCLGAVFSSLNPDAVCGAGGTCLVDSVDNSNVPNSADCYALCNGPGAGQSTCRTGYLCQSFQQADGGTAPQGFCWRSCQYTGCAPGTICQASGYCT
jgi:hypothetical protein